MNELQEIDNIIAVEINLDKVGFKTFATPGKNLTRKVAERIANKVIDFASTFNIFSVEDLENVELKEKTIDWVKDRMSSYSKLIIDPDKGLYHLKHSHGARCNELYQDLIFFN